MLAEQVATLLLTKCAAAGLTLAEIGSVVSRPLVGFEEELSQLEIACQAARSAVDLDMAQEDSGSDESEYGDVNGQFGRHREASLLHLLGSGEEKTGVVMGRRVCPLSRVSKHTSSMEHDLGTAGDLLTRLFGLHHALS